MPLAPDFGGCEHAAGATLVAEGSLTCSVGTAARDTGNTGHSATCEVVRWVVPSSI
jgi:hypothetical protein